MFYDGKKSSIINGALHLQLTNPVGELHYGYSTGVVF